MSRNQARRCGSPQTFGLLVLLAAATAVYAQVDTTVVQYGFEPPKIRAFMMPTSRTGRKAEFYRVRMPGLHAHGDPGMPVLPYKTARVLLPPGSELLSVNVRPRGERAVEGRFKVEPGQVEIPTSVDTFIYTPPGPVYDTARSFPGQLRGDPVIGDWRGFTVLSLELRPVRLAPREMRLSYFDTLELVVLTRAVKDTLPLFRRDSADFEELRRQIDNPLMLERYRNRKPWQRRSGLASGKWDMVIVTDSSLAPTFGNYANWKTQNRGIRTIVYTTADVYANYTGVDNQERIRNFLADAYSTWGIKYVLLGGDVDVVPYRACRVSGEDIPCDLYYGDLTGTWDSDGDGLYGEPGEGDLQAELFVGRVTVNTTTEAQNFFNKVYAYEQGILAGYRGDVLFFATNLSTTTFGGSYKDETEADEFPAGCYSITKLYENTGTISAAAVSAAINGGIHIGNSAGHGNSGGFGSITTTNVDALTNTDPCLIYTWACWTNAFDVSDAISEHFIYNPTGAFAYIGNSRYGWYSNSGDASGSSHDFELEFYDAMFNEHIARVGPMLQDSKEEFSASSTADGTHRWIYFGLNLLGDPSTPLRNRADLLVRDHSTDNGTLPSGGAFWTSPDIGVDAPPYTTGFVQEDPVYLQVNHLSVRVQNIGCTPATNVTVKLYWADPSGGIPWPSGWNPIGTTTIASVPAGGTVVSPTINWTPSGTAIGHRCLLATVECTDDPISIYDVPWDNNVAQRNITIVGGKASFEGDFVINPIPGTVRRSMEFSLIHAPRGTAARLHIPGTVEIAKGPDDQHITRTGGGCLSPGRSEWLVTVTASAQGRDSITTVRIPSFACNKKTVVHLKVDAPDGLPGRESYRVRIQETADRRPIGGLDFVGRY
jgi:hypothetical protein